ncbi:hypothetical protein VaNZ11_011067, partial [Volvox africanus]
PILAPMQVHMGQSAMCAGNRRSTRPTPHSSMFPACGRRGRPCAGTHFAGTGAGAGVGAGCGTPERVAVDGDDDKDGDDIGGRGTAMATWPLTVTGTAIMVTLTVR